MNKEVIYLEPEDDITDILTKLQQAKQKLVALVPPKKATMLRSAVNMKLVARAAKESDKVAVIVTADPAIVKMAMMAQIPIAKTLQSRPVVPTEDDVDRTLADEQVIDEDLADAETSAELNADSADQDHAKTPGKATSNASQASADESAGIINLDEESLENASKDAKKGTKSGKDTKKDQKVPSFEKYRKWIILGAVVGVLLIVMGIWAFVFAPAVKITVAMNTSSENFSEEVKFTTDQNAANPEEGVFYVEKQTYEQSYDANFTATGEEDRGDKAKGEVVISYSFRPSSYIGRGENFAFNVSEGDEFVESESGRVYRATANQTISWEYDNLSGLSSICAAGYTSSSCTLKPITIPVEAVSSGERYNLDAKSSWNPFQGASVSNPSAITGGTTKNVTVVSSSNVDDARDEVVKEHANENKTKFLEQLKRDSSLVLVEPSYTEEVKDLTSKPEVGGEVEGDTKPSISVKLVYSIYTVSQDDLEQYIEKKLSTGDDQRIYSVGNPYFDRYTNIDEPARLKTTVKTGPTVTEESIIERTKGKKIGEVQSLLRSINGVSSVNISTSYFWVHSVPNDDSRIEVDMTVEDK